MSTSQKFLTQPVVMDSGKTWPSLAVHPVIGMVRQFHDGIQARVQNDGEFSEPFEETNGVKQACVMASTLFSVMFSAMLMDAFQDSDTGFPIKYRFDAQGSPSSGSLLNL